MRKLYLAVSLCAVAYATTVSAEMNPFLAGKPKQTKPADAVLATSKDALTKASSVVKKKVSVKASPKIEAKTNKTAASETSKIAKVDAVDASSASSLIAVAIKDLKDENATLRTELSLGKQKLGTIDEASQKQLTDIKAALETEKKLHDATKIQLSDQTTKLAELSKQIEDLETKNTTLNKQLETSTTAIKDATSQLELHALAKNAAPPWYDGVTRNVVDSKVGEILVKTSATNIAIRVPISKLSSADQLFRTVFVEREKREDFVYYLLKHESVKVRQSK